MQRLAWMTCLVAYSLIVFGGYVASSESGMGCGPEWPLCNGAFLPSLHGATLVEFTHRIIGVVLAVMTVMLFLKVQRSRANSLICSASYWMIGLLIVQILLGAVVVVIDLPSLIITLHLLVAFLFMAILIFLWRATEAQDRAWGKAWIHAKRIHELGRSDDGHRTLRHVDIICGLLLATIALGGYIKHQQYGLSCGWLSCYDRFLPESGAQWLQFSHRLAAAAVAVYVLWFMRRTYVGTRYSESQTRVVMAAVVVVVQILLGIGTVLTSLEVAWAVGHLAAATALFAIVAETRVYLTFYHDGGRNAL